MSAYPNLLTPPSSNEDSPQSNCYSSPALCFGGSEQSFSLPQTSLAFDLDGINPTAAPYLKILEQPLDRFRFRYKSEMTGTHGSLCGQTSDRSRKQTYPTIELCNFNKRAKVRCSIYQHNTREDHKPHAHRLIKKQGKGEVDDPHDAYITLDDRYIHVFHSMGIIHTAKKNLVPELIRKKTQLKKEEVARLEGKSRELTQKEEVEIKGLAEADSKSINLNVVCLRFDAFYETNGILLPICPPVYSNSINNLKSALTGELKIVRMDHCTCPAKGGREIFILVERVTKKNIKVKFYELDDEDNILWEDYGRFSDLDVHHQYAIVFKAPPYKDVNIKSNVKVFIELERPSDRARSEAKEFTYTVNSTVHRPGSKRPRTAYSTSSYDTSASLASDELPLPINNLRLDNMHALGSGGLIDDDIELEVTSAELQQAMTNINSEEFRRIFIEFGPEYSLVTDAPTTFPRRINVVKARAMTAASAKGRNVRDTKPTYESSNSMEEVALAKQSVLDLQDFIRTHPSDDKAVSMLKHYLINDNKTNPLHVLVRHNEESNVMFLLKMIYVWKQHYLLNVRNDLYETPLHIAVSLNLEEIVANLLVCQADVSIVDADSNTALHLAVTHGASVSILERLLADPNRTDFIDAENNDGNTALNLAIENANLRALKLLCLDGADVNRRHKKNGFAPLRFAVEKQNIDVIACLLQQPDLNPQVEDFQEVTPLQAALQKDNPEVVRIVSEFMRDNNYVDVEIKNEVEECSEDEFEFEEKYSVKLEPQITSEELHEMYAGVKAFSRECLEEVARLLDASGRWEDLADLLDLGHLLRNGLCGSKGSSPTKMLLQLAIETNGDTIVEIRDFLDNLDENEAVEAIDNMVRAQLS